MHALLIVVGNGSIDEYMEPYDENLDVPRYSRGLVSEDEKKRCLDYYNEKRAKEHKEPYESFDECYAQEGNNWNGNRYEINAFGKWEEFSTYNPNSKYDWYQIGGRWPGQLLLKEGVVPEHELNFSLLWNNKEREKFLATHQHHTDMAKKGDIVNLDELKASDIMIDGEWIVLSDFAFKPVAEYLKDVSDDTMITCVDYHI